MRRVAMAILVMASTAGAQQFEGVVTYQMGAGGGKNNTWQYMAKGNKARIEVNDPTMPGGGGMSAILDVNANTYTVMMAAQKMYMVMPVNQNAGHTDTGGRGQVTKTGSEVIAGVPCDDYVGTDSKGVKQGTSCIAHGMGNFMWFGTNSALMKSWESRVSGLSAAIGNGGFPLKFTKSNGETTMLATKVERKSLDASLFSPPADYKQMQMPAGMPQ